jgi:flagellar hook assembly protein FlgD
MIPIPSGVIISNAAPNPFRDHTTLSISIPPTYKDLEINSGSGGTGNFLAQVATAVDVAVFDVAGRRVKTLRVDKVFDPVVTLSWDGTNTKNESVPSGIYFVRAQAGDVTGVSKVLLIR